MKSGALSLIGVALLVACSGCKLEEVRGSTKFGPSFQHRGSNRTNSTRWTVQQGLDFKWEDGINTGVTYRRRDTDDGNGNNDNAVFFDVSYPIWEAPKKPSKTKKKLKDLKERIETLEAELATLKAQLESGGSTTP